ncbi:MAG: flagellar export protein FliJ [Candidatus Zixiibacteriota bacterium]
MKKFKFRLETLLKVKVQTEKEKQREHALTLQKVYDQKDRLNQIDRNRQENMNRQRERLIGSMSLAEMLIYSRYFMKLKRDTVSGRELLRGLEKEEDKKRKALVKASKERKIYDKLKEKQQEKYNAEIELQEKKELDEIATNIFRQNK